MLISNQYSIRRILGSDGSPERRDTFEMLGGVLFISLIFLAGFLIGNLLAADTITGQTIEKGPIKLISMRVVGTVKNVEEQKITVVSDSKEKSFTISQGVEVLRVNTASSDISYIPMSWHQIEVGDFVDMQVDGTAGNQAEVSRIIIKSVE